MGVWGASGRIPETHGSETFPYGAKWLAEISKLVLADNGDDEESVISTSVFYYKEEREQKEKGKKDTIITQNF